MVDAERWPTMTASSGRCPRCGHVATFATHANSQVGYELFSVFRCNNCDAGIVVVEGVNKQPGGGWTTDGTVRHGWPPRGAADLDPDVPEPIASAYLEGQRALNADAPRAAATMFRGMLAEIVKDKGGAAATAKRTLYDQLEAMASDGTLHPSLAEWAKEIRIVGNAGAHPDPLMAIDRDDAAELAELARRFIDVVYETPARIARARVRRGTP